jgi:hypothetical protein
MRQVFWAAAVPALVAAVSAAGIAFVRRGTAA